MPGATEGEKTGGGTRTWTKPGGFDEANKDFDKMNPSNVGDKGNRGRLLAAVRACYTFARSDH